MKSPGPYFGIEGNWVGQPTLEFVYLKSMSLDLWNIGKAMNDQFCT